MDWTITAMIVFSADAVLAVAMAWHVWDLVRKQPTYRGHTNSQLHEAPVPGIPVLSVLPDRARKDADAKAVIIQKPELVQQAPSFRTTPAVRPDRTVQGPMPAGTQISYSPVNDRPEPTALPRRAVKSKVASGPHLSTVLSFGDYIVAAECAGRHIYPYGPAIDRPFHWTTSQSDVPSNAIAPVCIGAGDRGCLFLDLALAPGVITLTGDRPARDELAAELVNRLGTAARNGARCLAVIVAGSPFNSDLLVVDPITLPDMAAFSPSVLPEQATISFLVTTAGSSQEANRLNALAQAPGRRRIIPIVVDDVTPAAWSLCSRVSAYAASA